MARSRGVRTTYLTSRYENKKRLIESSIIKNSQSEENRRPFKELRLIVNPPSHSSLPVFIYETARQHDLRKFTVNYVSSATAVKVDGNCGYRAFAIGLEEPEDAWRNVRLQCLQELTSRPKHYTRLSGLQAPYSGMVHVAEHWVPMPLSGYVLANTYKRPIHFFSALDSYTFLPDNAPPNSNSPVSLLLMRHSAHYVNVRLTMDATIPQIKSWRRHATKDGFAGSIGFAKQMDMFTKLLLEHYPKEDPMEQVELEDILDPSQQLVDYELI
ncbi:hypothetical protein VTP01DRAFT_8132 [Rhizomucor pusillus]|uniref:uncharacterized protein n=1 Tax=Rhizomucor pusillus TaxID=4840 RepID=UPI003743A978